MITFKNVTKKYDYTTALNNVSFDINNGEIVGLIGANGAGKSTAIRLITKFIKADQGDIFIDNKNISDIEDYTISYIPDEPVYYDFMTVLEHLRFVNSMYPCAEYAIDEVISKFALNDHLDKTPHKLSKGNKQKLMLATALLRKFDYLIADEPFTGLDPNQISVLKNVLINLREKGKSVLLSTHLLNMVDEFCDRYIMIDKGEVIAYGSKEKYRNVVN